MVVFAYAPPHTLPDALLLEAARQGDSRAFEALWSRYRPALYRQAWKLAANADLVEDLLQDTCVKAFVALSDLRPGSAFGRWTAAILSNAWNDRYRSMLKLQIAPPPADDEDYLERVRCPRPTPCEELLDAETRRQTLAALARLRREHPRLAEAVDLHIFREIPFVEMGPNASTLRSHYRRARAKLAEYLREMNAGPGGRGPARRGESAARRVARGRRCRMEG